MEYLSSTNANREKKCANKTLTLKTHVVNKLIRFIKNEYCD